MILQAKVFPAGGGCATLAAHLHLEVRNVVASCALGCRLETRDVVARVPGARAEVRKPTTAQLRVPAHSSTALITSSGKLIITGARSIDALHESMTLVKRQLSDAGFPIDLGAQIAIHNVVGVANLGTQVSLTRLASGLQSVGVTTWSYDPEIFPGLILRGETSATILVFSSGKIVCSGGKTNLEYGTLWSLITEQLPDARHREAAAQRATPTHSSAPRVRTR